MIVSLRQAFGRKRLSPFTSPALFRKISRAWDNKGGQGTPSQGGGGPDQDRRPLIHNDPLTSLIPIARGAMMCVKGGVL